MEAMLGISLYNYPYLKVAKMLCLSYYRLCLLFNKTDVLSVKWKHCSKEKLKSKTNGNLELGVPHIRWFKMLNNEEIHVHFILNIHLTWRLFLQYFLQCCVNIVIGRTYWLKLYFLWQCTIPNKYMQPLPSPLYHTLCFFDAALIKQSCHKYGQVV
jgi:hypothetical protein